MEDSGVHVIFMYVEQFTKNVSPVPVRHFPVWGNRLQIRLAAAARCRSPQEGRPVHIPKEMGARVSP